MRCVKLVKLLGLRLIYHKKTLNFKKSTKKIQWVKSLVFQEMVLE